jgi:hypothetical protein
VRDLTVAPEQGELARSIATLVTRTGHEAALRPTAELWRELAGVGVLGLCTDDVGGTPADAVVAFLALGRTLCPGPLVASMVAATIVPEGLRERIVDGTAMATTTDGRHVPWGDTCAVALELAADGAWIVEPVGARRATTTMSGEPWVVASMGRVERLGGIGVAQATRARRLFDLALSAYLVGAGGRVVEQAADHARSRVQFGRPIGDFQAVAHPLARSRAELDATTDLLRLLALALDERPDLCGALGAQRTAAAAVARRAAERAHQVMGAMGFAAETGLAVATTRIAQWSQLPPHDH